MEDQSSVNPHGTNRSQYATATADSASDSSGRTPSTAGGVKAERVLSWNIAVALIDIYAFAGATMNKMNEQDDGIQVIERRG